MKKALSLILALVLCLSLCACGKDVESDSVGVWVYEMGKGQHFILVLASDATVTYYEAYETMDESVYAHYGTYSIKDKVVTVELDDNRKLELSCVYDGGNLKLVRKYEVSNKEYEQEYNKADRANMPGFSFEKDYTDLLANKTFVAEGGQKLTFNGDGTAAYDFTNGIGTHYHYPYNYGIRVYNEGRNYQIALLNTETGELEIASWKPDKQTVKLDILDYLEQ